MKHGQSISLILNLLYQQRQTLLDGVDITYFHIFLDGKKVIDDDDFLFVLSVMAYIKDNFCVDCHTVATLGNFNIYYSMRNNMKYIPDYPTMQTILKNW